jgi:hypothetical protein
MTAVKPGDCRSHAESRLVRDWASAQGWDNRAEEG